MHTVGILDKDNWVSLNVETGIPVGTKVAVQIQSAGAALLKTSTSVLNDEDYTGVMLRQDGENGIKIINTGADEIYARTNGVYEIKLNIERVSV